MWTFTKGLMGDKKPMGPDVGHMECPWWSDCPSHKPFRGAKPHRNEIVERIQPYVYKIRCKYCGMMWIQDVTNPDTQEGSKSALEMNPALVGGRKVI